jgi:hypothetical protein
MTVLAKSALPLSAAIILALSGCSSGSGSSASHAGGTPTATTQQPAPDASDASGGATASDGSGTASPAASGHLHACVLVSEQDATTALGAYPGTGGEQYQEGAFGGNSTCTYGVASVGVQVSASSIAGKALCDGNRQPNSVDVPGVGDRAFETPATGAQEATVYFLKGDICVSITIETPAAMGSAKDRVIALATTAAGRA